MRVHTDEQSILRETAVLCLNDLSIITAQFLGELEREDAYTRSSVSWQEVETTAIECFELQLRLMGDLDIPHRLEGISARVGRTRARQGIPIDTVMQAVRADFRFLWNAILRRLPAERLSEFASEAVTVWEEVEKHSTAVYSGYMEEVGRERSEREDKRAAAFARLFDEAPVDSFTAQTSASVMGLSVADSFIVAVAPPDHSSQLRQAAERNACTQALYTRDGVLGVLLPYRENAEPPEWLTSTICAIAPPATGIKDVPSTWALARNMASTIGSKHTRSVDLYDVWPEVLASVSAPISEAIAAMVFAPLEGTPTREIERLAETLTDFLVTGSTTKTAKNLYRHRNTIIKRLESFSSKTKFDLNSPRDAAAVVLALANRSDIHPPQTSPPA